MTTRAALNLSAAVAAASALALLLDAPSRAQEPVRMGILQAVTGPFTKNGTENWVAMQIARDNARLSEENARLRRENADLVASAELWIRLYEAALERANACEGTQR